MQILVLCLIECQNAQNVKKSPKEVNIVSKSIKSRLTWLSALLRNFVFLHQVMVAGGLDP